MFILYNFAGSKARIMILFIIIIKSTFGRYAFFAERELRKGAHFICRMCFEIYALYFFACKLNIYAYLPPAAISSAWVPLSAISPFSIT